MGLHIHNRNEGGGPWWKTAEWTWSTHIRGKYTGTLLRGWWKLGADSINRHFEIELALGGEDNMLQAGIVLPFLMRVHVGVRVPRKMCGWIYERREWTLRIGYIGRWVELLIASDEHMRDTGMVSYYRRRRENPDCECGHGREWHAPVVKITPHSAPTIADFDRLAQYIDNPTGRCITPAEVNHACEPCGCAQYQAEALPWSRLALWPGWHLTFNPRLRDRLFGRTDCITTKGEPEPVVVPMPEGNYPGTMRREDRVWKRKRWPWPSHTSTDYWIEMQVGVPTPGKGENSWDCEDDGIYGTGGKTPAEAVANVTRAALRQRERYAGKGWTPDAGWPEGVLR